MDITCLILQIMKVHISWYPIFMNRFSISPVRLKLTLKAILTVNNAAYVQRKRDKS